jgi:replicative DNA helicase
MELTKSQLVVNQSFSLTTDDILRMARQQKDLQAIVVDHLGLLQSATGRFLGRTELVTEISGALKRMALTLNVPVLALSQLNRAGESGANQRPKLSHLRDSGSIEQDADVVMLLHREDYGMPGCAPSLLHVGLAKNRFGENADVALNVSLAYDQVSDLSAKPKQ